MLRRIMIQDASGSVLEFFENNNDLYYLQKLSYQEEAGSPGVYVDFQVVLPLDVAPAELLVKCE